MKVSDGFQQKIQSHLEEAKLTDQVLNEALNKEDRTLEKCCQYIINEVKKLFKGQNSVAMEENEVYDIAKRYYLLEKIEEIKAPVVARVETTPTPIPLPKKVKKQEDNSGLMQLSLFD